MPVGLLFPAKAIILKKNVNLLNFKEIFVRFQFDLQEYYTLTFDAYKMVNHMSTLQDF